ncbi:MAG: protein kinase [Acidobacteriota bacterium]|nr:protein kinase [Acidobacteriota bacterium]
MALTVGSRIGPFEITGALGVGGMGEVYRAVDANLGRSVAIKVLPDAFAQDPERLARFEREAKTLASLNHSNIAQVFGLEKGGTDLRMRALVMELVEGPTLADRIAKGPIPLDEAVPIAIQIAEALESAHDQGIVHRDLKPANVKVRDDGTVKVLDFGLAKAMGPSSEMQSGALANSPTITSAGMTQAGVVLGTAAYMSPEQAKGRAVNQRADIWAFGCVLFEMLTGTRAFGGEDISDVLVAIIRDEPAWQALPASTPPHIRNLLRRCLQKDVKKRIPHIGVARLELAGGADATTVPSIPPARAGAVMRERVAWALAGTAVVAAIAFALRPAATQVASSNVVSFEITAADGQRLIATNGAPRFSVSPDGTMVVYQVADVGKDSQLWLRRLDSPNSRPIPNTEAGGDGDGTQQPFWSPDGRYIGFFDGAAQKLKKIELQSGVVQVLADVPRNQYGGSWNDDGVIIAATVATNGVQRVSAAGGATTQVTTLNKVTGETSHLWPEFLPDGRHFVYLSTRVEDPAKPSGRSLTAIFIATLDGGTPKFLVDSPLMARFAPPDQMLYVREGALVAQRLDLGRLELVGEPRLVASGVQGTLAGRAALSVSKTGVLVYTAAGTSGERFDATWVDRAGREIAGWPPLRGVSAGLRLSPDGTHLAFTRGSSATGTRPTELWIYEPLRRVETRLAREVGVSAPVFSPDGLSVAFLRETATGSSIHTMPISGATTGEVLLNSRLGSVTVPTDWSPDGRWLAYSENMRTSNVPSFWFLPLAGDRKPTQFPGLTDVAHASVSPDGRRLLYSTTGVGRQVFVQTFPDVTVGRWPVSPLGASHARWRRDGREIFFLNNGRLWAVPVAAGPRFQAGEATPLFDFANSQLGPISPYDVSPDGQRIVVLRERGAAVSPALTVLVNWPASLQAPPAATP